MVSDAAAFENKLRIERPKDGAGCGMALGRSSPATGHACMTEERRGCVRESNLAPAQIVAGAGKCYWGEFGAQGLNTAVDENIDAARIEQHQRIGADC